MVDDALRGEPGEKVSMVLTNPPFGKRSSFTVVNSEGEAGARGAHLPPRRLLGYYIQQATQLRSARPLTARDKRSGRHGGPRQRPFRRWSWRVDPPATPPRMRRPHAVAPPDRHLLRRRCQGKRALLRPTTRIGESVDLAPLGLRPPQQPALHPEANPLRAEDLADFIRSYNPLNRHDRAETERFRPFTSDELIGRDKASLDVMWLRDETLEDTDNLPAPAFIMDCCVRPRLAAAYLTDRVQVREGAMEAIVGHVANSHKLRQIDNEVERLIAEAATRVWAAPTRKQPIVIDKTLAKELLHYS